MPRVVVMDDNGTLAWSERVTPADFETEHFRRCLSQRLCWALADAEPDPPHHAHTPAPPAPPANNSPGDASDDDASERKKGDLMAPPHSRGKRC